MNAALAVLFALWSIAVGNSEPSTSSKHARYYAAVMFAALSAWFVYRMGLK